MPARGTTARVGVLARTLSRGLLLLAAGAFAPAASGYEADVHFGLTRWLALRAGFDPAQADAIANGDQRIDGEALETLTLSLEFGCTVKFVDVARQAQAAHFPSARAVPAPPSERPVVAGGEPARRDLARLTPLPPGREAVMLVQLGAALHPLQDSWAHQGTPGVPDFGGAVTCDAGLVSGHPADRGGPASHRADLTASSPADVIPMAAATYAELLRYPAIHGKVRTAAPWASVAAAMPGFVQAKTKTEKRHWFVAQGMPDTRFLAGISLPDGPDAGDLSPASQRFLPLPGEGSRQYDAPAEVRRMFDTLFARWLGGEPPARIVSDLGPPRGQAPSSANGMSARELAVRLDLWRVRDHGVVAELAHARSPMSPDELKAAARLTRAAGALLPATTLSAAVYPLQPSGPAPSPLLPYIVRALPVVAPAPARMIALARLRHAPYDTVGWIAEQRDGRWELVDIVSSPDL